MSGAQIALVLEMGTNWYILIYTMFLFDLIGAFNKEHIQYAVAGGYAVALHGAVRGTVDVDLVLALDRENLIKAEAILKKLGLVSRLPISAEDVFSFRDEYIKKRNLIGWNFYSSQDPTHMVDLIITHDLRTMKTVTKKVGSLNIEILGINDLIEMKRQAGRPQDLADINALEKIKS